MRSATLLAAIATGGAVERIVLDANQGGAAYTRGGIPFVTLSAGYLGSLLWGVLFVMLGFSSGSVPGGSSGPSASSCCL